MATAVTIGIIVVLQNKDDVRDLAGRHCGSGAAMTGPGSC